MSEESAARADVLTQDAQGPLTAIWQTPLGDMATDFSERDWIDALFGNMISSHVIDGRREVVCDDALVIDSYLYARDSSYYRRFAGRRAFLLHLGDETFEGGYENYKHFNGVIRNYYSRAFDLRQTLHIPLGYASKPSQQGLGPAASERPYMWSFAGAARKASRPDMLRHLNGIGPHRTVITDDPMQQESGFLTREELNRVMADSIVVPCPMGNVNLESFRVYEALEAGCIPIVEKRFRFDYFAELLGPNPIPKVRSWSQAASILRGFYKSPSTANALQHECYEWWALRKTSVSMEIERFIGRRGKQKCSSPFLPGGAGPGWRIAELIRHHSALALGRRVKMQVTRIATEGRIRATYGR